MKKLLLLVALGISLCANAQLTVFNDGLVRVGNASSLQSATGVSVTLDVSSKTSSTSSVNPTGVITFGSGTNSMIIGCSSLGKLSLYGASMLTWGVGPSSDVLSLTAYNRSLTSSYDIKAPAFLTTSDARLKKNVESLTDSYEGLLAVNPVSYNLTGTVTSEDTPAADMAVILSDDNNAEVSDERTHFGFIAQEIQKVYPNLVVEDGEGMLAIDYTGFIPLLVEAYKDLAGKVKEQEEVIEALLTQKGPSYMPASVNGLTESKASLKQNKPNPFNTTTTIECSVPQSVASAFICVYDLQGKQVHRIDIRERGDIVNVIDASYFAPGMYIYALIADGVEIDSKRMIITD